MATLADSLDRIYRLATEAKTDPAFYEAIYQYCHLVNTDSTLSRIVLADQLEYANKHGAIWDDKVKDSKQKTEETYRLERFSMYCDLSSLQVRIYEPLEDYKTSDGKESDQDPVALLLLKGIKNVPTTKYSKKTFKLHNQWFDGKRSMYEHDLRQFHAKMLNALEKPVPVIKPELSFDAERSELHIDRKVVSLTLKNDPPLGHYILDYLFSNEEGLGAKAYYSEMQESERFKDVFAGKSSMSFYRACNDINAKVLEQTKVKDFLTIKTGNSGWTQINTDYL